MEKLFQGKLEIFYKYWKINGTVSVISMFIEQKELNQSKVEMIPLWIRNASLQMKGHLKLPLQPLWAPLVKVNWTLGPSHKYLNYHCLLKKQIVKN